MPSTRLLDISIVVIETARIVGRQTGPRIQMHALAKMDGEYWFAKITVEASDENHRGSSNRFTTFKGVKIKNAQDAIGAFPSGDGGNPASPEREMTLDCLA